MWVVVAVALAPSRAQVLAVLPPTRLQAARAYEGERVVAGETKTAASEDRKVCSRDVRAPLAAALGAVLAEGAAVPNHNVIAGSVCSVL